METVEDDSGARFFFSLSFQVLIPVAGEVLACVAAEQDLASAQYLAGVMLDEGIGTSRDYDRAIAWLQRAVANGSADAALLLQRLQAGD